MWRKILASLAVITIIASMAGCDEESANVIETTIPIETTMPKTHYSREVYLDMVYGYYELDDSYINISEGNYQEKNKESGEIIIEGTLIDGSVSLEKDNVVSFEFNFYRAPYPSINWNMNSEGDIATEYGVSLKRISQEEYESVQPIYTEPETTATEVVVNDYTENDYVYTPPWYMEYFNTSYIGVDLYEIEVAFATGKEERAKELIQDYLYDEIGDVVKDLISQREYWIAQNYIAMYQDYIWDNKYDYPLTYDYLENKVQKAYGKYTTNGIDAIVQQYYHDIDEAADNDTDVLSEQECLYKTNEYLISKGYRVTSNLWDYSDYFCYVHDLVDNGESYWDFVINPYTQTVRELPDDYFFIDGNLNIANNENASFD